MRNAPAAVVDPQPFGAMLSLVLMCRYCGELSPRTIWKLVASGDLPRPVYPPGTRRALWIREDVDSAIARWGRRRK
jgi:predicted DNA-binding transcriptional regulator AlpA